MCVVSGHRSFCTEREFSSQTLGEAQTILTATALNEVTVDHVIDEEKVSY